MFGFIIFRSLFRLFFSYPFMGNNGKNSLYYYWKVTNSLAGYFTRIFPNSLHYIWTFACLFAGVFFVSFWKYPLLILESFHLFVRVFNWTFSKNPPTIIGHLPYPLAGYFKKIAVIYYLSTTIGHSRYET